MNVKNADTVANLDNALNVLGREQNHEMTAAITEKTMVH